jgi:hypothetical protein
MILLIILGSKAGHSQEQQTLIGETILNYDKYLARLRPVVYAANTKVYRVDVMIGRKFYDHFTFLLYWKNDTKNKNRLGFRSELTWKFFDEKINASMQYRYFWGLNQETQNQYIFIPAIDYKTKFVRYGIWCFGVKELGSDLSAYLGPTLNFSFTNHIGWFVSYNYDLFSSKHLFYTILYFTFDLKKAKSN